METLKKLVAIIILFNILPLAIGITNIYDNVFELGSNSAFIDGYFSGVLILIISIMLLVLIFWSVKQFEK